MSSANTREALDRRHAQMVADVRDGLLHRPRELPPKYFYDERGSQLFEDITRLPEYYLTRAETEILHARAAEIVATTDARTMIELGAGSATKTRILLDAMQRATKRRRRRHRRQGQDYPDVRLAHSLEDQVAAPDRNPARRQDGHSSARPGATIQDSPVVVLAPAPCGRLSWRSAPRRPPRRPMR